jgi:hypothetical protein
VTEAYDTSSACSMPNVSPASTVESFRFVATRTGTRDVPSVLACATGTNAPCDSRAHRQHKIADAIAAAVSIGNVPINAIRARPVHQGITLLVVSPYLPPLN